MIYKGNISRRVSADSRKIGKVDVWDRNDGFDGDLLWQITAVLPLILYIIYI